MKTHIVVHAIILDKENRVLITKRAPNLKIYPNLWSIPAGHIEENESFEDCLKREIKEELGVNITKIVKSIQPYEGELDSRYWKVKLFIIDVDVDEINPNKEIADYKWIDPKDVYNFKTTPILDKHFKRAGIL